MQIGIDIRIIGKKRTGDEAYFFNLVKNLSAMDKKNNYILFTDRSPEEDKNLKKEISKLNLGNNFEIKIINSPNKFWWNLWALPTYLKKNPVDIFHTQYIAPFWLPKKIKLVLTIHDISFKFFPKYIKKSDLFFLKTLIPRSIRRADKIITVSDNERKNILDFYKISPEKVDFVYNGVNFEKFTRVISSVEKENVRKKYKLPEKFLLYIGTLQPRKNIPTLVEAFDLLPNQSDIKLVIAGNKEAHNFDKRIDKAFEKSNLSDKIFFPGWIDEENKPILVQMAECFVFPSLYEGFGIPIIEAMAAGTPVICSNIPSLKEIGNNAVLFADPQNPADFAEKIREVITDENMRNDLIDRGIELAKTFSWQKTAKETLEIYKVIMKSTGT